MGICDISMLTYIYLNVDECTDTLQRQIMIDISCTPGWIKTILNVLKKIRIRTEEQLGICRHPTTT